MYQHLEITGNLWISLFEMIKDFCLRVKLEEHLLIGKKFSQNFSDG